MNAQASNQAAQTMVINHVLQTNDYSLFKHIAGNRVINKLHLSRLKQSFQKEYLLSPIIVNQHMEIIDGQHRFEAAKDLDLPIRYFICNDYGLSQIQMLNANASNWKKADYLSAYCDLGYEQYLLVRGFAQRYPDFTLTVCETLLSGNLGGSKNRRSKALVSTNKGGYYATKDFERGEFIVKDYEGACVTADKIMDMKHYFKGYNQRLFIMAMAGIFKNPNYNHQRMLKKLQSHPTILQVGVTVTQTKQLIEELYNYHSADKVSLRFF